MTIANQLTFSAKLDQERLLKATLNDLVENALLEKGCQKFELYQLYETPQQFFIVEIWKSDKSYQNHLKNKQYQTLVQEMQKHLHKEEKFDLKLTQCLTKLGLKSKKEEKK